MAISYVWWQTLTKLECIDTLDSELFICVTPSKIAPGGANPFAIEGYLNNWVPVKGDAYYRYNLRYDDSQLVAGAKLLSTDVLGVICKDCLTDWAEGNTPTIHETDPIFSASPASTITNADIVNWNTPAGPETDPIFTAWLATPPNVSTFTNDVGYLTAEIDPVFTAWLATSPLDDYFKLDQTLPQTVTNGIPIFEDGWQSNKWYRNRLGTTLEVHTGRDDAFDAIATSTTDAGALTSIRTAMNQGSSASTTILATSAYRLWIGHNQPFNTIGMWIITGASANTTIVEYWNGSVWTSVTGLLDGTNNLSIAGTITFTIPGDWAVLNKDGIDRYWIKIRTNVSTSTDATVQLIQPIAYTTNNLFSFLPNPLDTETTNGIFVNNIGKVRIPRINGALSVEGALSSTTLTLTSNISGATTIAHSGLQTSTLSGTTETPIVGHYLLGAATTGVTAALVPTRYSPSIRLASQAWDIDAGVNIIHRWQLDSTPYAGNTTSSRLRITVGSDYTNLINISDDGITSFLGTIYGAEVLTNGGFTSGTSWITSGGFSLVGDTAVYVHNAGGGTLTQVSGDFATSLLPNRWYRLTYTTSAINTTARMYIGSDISIKEREYLQGTLVAGTYTQWFKTNASPGNFVIYADSAAALDGFTLDDISLVPVISGDVEAMGTIWGQGYYSADRTAGASATTGGVTFKNGLYTSGTIALTAPAGSNTQMQYNNSGVFGGTTGLTWVSGSSQLKFNDNIYAAFGTGADTKLYTNSSDHFYIENDTSNADIFIKVNDGGVDTTMVQFDSSISRSIFFAPADIVNPFKVGDTSVRATGTSRIVGDFTSYSNTTASALPIRMTALQFDVRNYRPFLSNYDIGDVVDTYMWGVNATIYKSHNISGSEVGYGEVNYAGLYDMWLTGTVSLQTDEGISMYSFGTENRVTNNRVCSGTTMYTYDYGGSYTCQLQHPSPEINGGTWYAELYGFRAAVATAGARNNGYSKLYGALVEVQGLNATEAWGIYSLGSNGTVHNFLGNDNQKTFFGTAYDASIYYDATNLVINPKEVGSGILDVLGVIQSDGYNSSDGTAGATGTITLAAITTITVKNGLITAWS